MNNSASDKMKERGMMILPKTAFLSFKTNRDHVADWVCTVIDHKRC